MILYPILTMDNHESLPFTPCDIYIHEKHQTTHQAGIQGLKLLSQKHLSRFFESDNRRNVGWDVYSNAHRGNRGKVATD